MNHRFAVLTLAVTLALSLTSVMAGPAEDCPCCNVACSVEKTDDGFRCTIKAKGDADVGALRDRIRAGNAHCSETGVSVSFEDIDGGIVVVRTAEDEDVVKALHEMADGCAKGTRGFCPKGAGPAGCSKHKADCCKGKMAGAGCGKRPPTAL